MTARQLVPLDKGAYRELVRRALAEDMGWGDVTTEAIVDESQRGVGRLLAKQRCVVAGLDIAEETFLQLDPAASMTRTRPNCSMTNLRSSPAGCTIASGALTPVTYGSSFTFTCASAAAPQSPRASPPITKCLSMFLPVLVR